MLQYVPDRNGEASIRSAEIEAALRYRKVAYPRRLIERNSYRAIRLSGNVQMLTRGRNESKMRIAIIIVGIELDPRAPGGVNDGKAAGNDVIFRLA